MMEIDVGVLEKELNEIESSAEDIVGKIDLIRYCIDKGILDYNILTSIFDSITYLTNELSEKVDDTLGNPKTKINKAVEELDVDDIVKMATEMGIEVVHSDRGFHRVKNKNGEYVKVDLNEIFKEW